MDPTRMRSLPWRTPTPTPREPTSGWAEAIGIKALKDYDTAVRLQPKNAAFLNSRGFTWHMKGIEDKDRPACEDRALSDYAAAIRIDPKYASAINNRTWLLATSKVDRCRDGKEAVTEATKACEH